MKTAFDIATRQELENIYLDENSALSEQDKTEILAELKRDLSASSDDAKRKSLIKVALLRSDHEHAKALYHEITDRDYAQSVGQELLDAGILGGSLDVADLDVASAIPSGEPATDEDLTARLSTLLEPLLEGRAEVEGKPVEEWLSELAILLTTSAAAGESEKNSKNMVNDASPIAEYLERALAARFCAKEQAAQDIKPLVGEVSAMAFDSAEAIYAYAVDRMGLKAAGYPGEALKGIVAGLVDARRNQAQTSADGMTGDAKTGLLSDLNLGRFTVSK